MLLAALAGWACAARAAPWTVEALVDYAQSVSPSVLSAQEAVNAAAGERRQAGLIPNPTAAVEDAIDWKYTLTQSIEFPLARSARLAVFDRQAEQARLRLDLARRELRAQVQTLAYQILAVRQRLGLVEDNVRLLSRLRATLPARYQPGLKSTAETLRIDLETARTRDELRRIRAEEGTVRARLNAFLLQPSSAPLELQGELAPSFVNIDVAALQSRAGSSDYGLLLAAAGQREQEARLKAARASRWPTIDAGPNLGKPKDTSVLLGGFQAGLSLPLWDWRQGDVRAAQARRAAAGHDLEAARRQLEADVERLGQDYLSAKDRAEALTQQGLLEQAVKIRTQALLAYQQGLLNLTDTLDAIRTSTQVQQDYIQSLLDGRQAVIELELHLGGPL